MKIDKKELEIWTSHLYAGTFKKGKGQLESKKGNCCCLGVGCRVLIPEELLELDRYKRLDGSFPDEQKYSPKLLTEINDDFFRKTGLHLSSLNDNRKDDILYARNGLEISGLFTHPEIADLLQLVYVHKMLD